jgi:hypothetical protein
LELKVHPGKDIDLAFWNSERWVVSRVGTKRLRCSSGRKERGVRKRIEGGLILILIR